MLSKADPDLLTTEEAAKLGGVGPSSIKRWADSGQLECVKTPGGHRRFRRRVLESFFGRSNGTEPSDQKPPSLDIVLKANRHEVDAELSVLRARRGSWYAVADEIGVLLQHIGKAWESGTISVAEEHRATDCLVRAINRICDTFPTTTGSKVCILACPPGDDHTIGLHLAELCLKEFGWDTLWLGRMTPAQEVLKVIEFLDVSMVAISASSFSLGLTGLGQMIAELGPHCRQRSIPLVLGGQGSTPIGSNYAYPLTSFASFRELLGRLS